MGYAILFKEHTFWEDSSAPIIQLLQFQVPSMLISLYIWIQSRRKDENKQKRSRDSFNFFCKNCFLLAREIWRTLVWKPNFDLIKAKSKLSVAVEGVLVPISIFQYPAKFNSYLIQIFPSAKVKSWKTIEKTFYFNRFQTKKVSLGIE